MTQDSPATEPVPQAEGALPLKGLPRKAILLLIALCCCCGSPFLWIAVEAHRGNQIRRLHDSLQPGMSVAEVFHRVD